VCRSNLNGNAANISSNDRDFLLFTRNIWIPEGARCCSSHLIDRQLKRAALDQIKSFFIRQQELDSSDVHLMLSKSQKLFENEKTRFSFDNPRDLSDDEYRLLTSLSRDEFNDLVDIISSFLASMFHLPDKRAVSRTIDSARQAILKTFVPNHLGFGHVTRQDVIDRHTTTIARELMCGGSSSTAIVVIDGSYIYIQVRNSFSLARCHFFNIILEISK
jgi:hypothetical protein